VQPSYLDARLMDLHRAYNTLSPPQRAMVALHLHDGYTVVECRPSSVAGRARRESSGESRGETEKGAAGCLTLMSPTKNSPTSRGPTSPDARNSPRLAPRIRRREFRIRTPEDEALGVVLGAPRLSLRARWTAGVCWRPPCITSHRRPPTQRRKHVSYRPLSRTLALPPSTGRFTARQSFGHWRPTSRAFRAIA